jgi:anaerobic selenocysteine-containing dehydrogenase
MRKIEKRIPVETIGGLLKVPVFTLEFIPEGLCAGYAKVVAKDLFGIQWRVGDAWNLRYMYKTLSIVNGKERGVFDRNDVLPGCLVGCYFDQSVNNNRLDCQGNPVLYTHMLTYLGKRKRDMQHVFTEQRIKTRRVLSLLEILMDETIKLREVILPVL